MRLRFESPAMPLRRVRVSQTAEVEPDDWRVAEMRVYRSGSELARSSRWRLRAWPNPWDVQLAFDNNPTTSWTSAQALFTGMYVEVDFGSPESIDGVVLEVPRQRGGVRIRLDGMDAEGRWAPLANQPRLPEEVPLPSDLRRAASEQLKARGIGHIIVFDDDWQAADFMLNSYQWGIRQLAELNHARLYEIR